VKRIISFGAALLLNLIPSPISAHGSSYVLDTTDLTEKESWFEETFSEAREHSTGTIFRKVHHPFAPNVEYKPRPVVRLNDTGPPPAAETSVDEPFDTAFFGYNTIGEDNIISVTYSIIQKDGTWLHEPIDLKRFQNTDEKVGSYGGFLDRGGVIPLPRPPNTAPITDTVTFHHRDKSESVPVFESGGDFFVRLKRGRQGWLRYDVSAHVAENTPQNADVPFDIPYNSPLEEHLQALDELPQIELIDSFRRTIVESLSYSQDMDTAERYASVRRSGLPFRTICDVKTRALVDLGPTICSPIKRGENLIYVTLENKKGDCDVGNNLGIAIARDRYGLPLNLSLGNKCDAEKCVLPSDNILAHGWGTMLGNKGIDNIDMTPLLRLEPKELYTSFPINFQ
jgi:hypothetical protein